MYNRYAIDPVKNNSKNYDEIFKERNVKFIFQFPTPVLKNLQIDNIKNVDFITHTWSFGDRYYKLAEKYFGDGTDWWVIARINNKPTESHNKIGDVIFIPRDIRSVISYLL